MKYKLIAFDCDGVLVDAASSWNYIHEKFGVTNNVSLESYMSGEIDGIEFMRRDIALWRAKDPQISLKKIERILDTIPPMKGLDELAKALKECGCKAVIISGGLDLLVDKIAKRLGAFKAYSNGLAADRKGRLTGEGILRVEPKDKSGPLRDAMKTLHVKKHQVVAVGDTAGDATMFNDCSLSIAFNPQDETIKKKAKKTIMKKDLKELLEILA
jgi:phosphoserine phosphatase